MADLYDAMNSINSTEEESTKMYIWFLNFGRYFQIHYPASIALCISGVFTNILNIIVLTRREMRKNSVNFLLTVSAVADICFLFLQATYAILYFSCPTFAQKVTISSWIMLYGGFTFELVMGIVSEWVNVTVGAWRFIAVTFPFRAKELCSLRRARMAVLIILVLSVLVVIPYSFIYDAKNVTFAGYNIIILSQDYACPVYLYFAIMVSILKATPILLLLCITIALIRNIALHKCRPLSGRQLSGNSGTEDYANVNRTTLMLTVLMVIFMVTNSPNVVLYYSYYSNSYDILSYHNIYFFLQEVDANTTFFVFFFMSRKFKHTFLNLIRSHKKEPVRIKPSLESQNRVGVY